MKLTNLTSLAFLATTGLAVPAAAQPASDLDKRTFFCVSQSDAEKFIDRFIGVLTKQGSDLGDYLTTVDKLLAPNFQEVSDSINSLAGFPVRAVQRHYSHLGFHRFANQIIPQLGSVTTPSKEAYIAGLSHAPADTGIETTFISVANCKDVVWRWNFKGIGSAAYPVKGFNYFSLQRQASLRVPWVANKLELEFNR